jgi:hypothetical protein
MLWSVENFCQAHLLEPYNVARTFNCGDIAHLCNVGFCVHFSSRCRAWAATCYALGELVLSFHCHGNFFYQFNGFSGHVHGLQSAASALYFSQHSYLGKILSATASCQKLYET